MYRFGMPQAQNVPHNASILPGRGSPACEDRSRRAGVRKRSYPGLPGKAVTAFNVGEYRHPQHEVIKKGKDWHELVEVDALLLNVIMCILCGPHVLLQEAAAASLASCHMTKSADGELSQSTSNGVVAKLNGVSIENMTRHARTGPVWARC